jgi:hypothetical protein
MGRQGNTDSLSLPAVGLAADKRGLLKVNDFYQVSYTTPLCQCNGMYTADAWTAVHLSSAVSLRSVILAIMLLLSNAVRLCCRYS